MIDKVLTSDVIINILGEVVWHSVTLDDSVLKVSQDHMQRLLNIAHDFLTQEFYPPRFLEVASYAHITGYMLAEHYQWEVTLLDISVDTLALGARYASEQGFSVNTVQKVAADFHQLPFNDCDFDIVYISSALHHTLHWQTVLNELLRVTRNGGLLIIDNEPCQRDFSLYKFKTNRREMYRHPEAELERLGIIATIAQPFPGSRQESLFNMTENQSMPISEMLDIMRSQGIIEELKINTDICMSQLDHKFLNYEKDESKLSKYITYELTSRLQTVRRLTTNTDKACGISLPKDSEIELLSNKIARSIVNLSTPNTDDYMVSLASIFGAAISCVIRKNTGISAKSPNTILRYFNDEYKGIMRCFPPKLNMILNQVSDLLPNIQVATIEQVERHFPKETWTYASNEIISYIVLTKPIGKIQLPSLKILGTYLVLIRVYGAPYDEPFHVAIYINGIKISGMDVYQTDSFLLQGILPKQSDLTEFNLTVSCINGQPIQKLPTVTIGAIRFVIIGDNGSSLFQVGAVV